MSLVFTEYVQMTAAGAGSEPSHDRLYGAALKKLRDALVNELKRRSLWTSPPSYLGVVGYASWPESGAVEELLSDCFVFIFVERLQSLKAQLKVKMNIEGMAFRSLRNFLYDTQKKYDPLGFRAFLILQQATLQALDSGLHVMTNDTDQLAGGKPRINNETTLSFRKELDEAAPRIADLGQMIEKWIPDLLPDLVLAKGKRKQAVTAELTSRLVGLSTQLIGVFRFKDLITPFKHYVRSYWQAISRQEEDDIGFEDSDDETRTVVRLAGPDPGPEEREAFCKLLACVEATLDRYDGSEEETSHLKKIWQLVRIHAAEPGKNRMLSQRRIEQRSGIPRHVLPNLFESLKDWLGACRESLCLPQAS